MARCPWSVCTRRDGFRGRQQGQHARVTQLLKRLLRNLRRKVARLTDKSARCTDEKERVSAEEAALATQVEELTERVAELQGTEGSLAQLLSTLEKSATRLRREQATERRLYTASRESLQDELRNVEANSDQLDGIIGSGILNSRRIAQGERAPPPATQSVFLQLQETTDEDEGDGPGVGVFRSARRDVVALEQSLRLAARVQNAQETGADTDEIGGATGSVIRGVPALEQVCAASWETAVRETGAESARTAIDSHNERFSLVVSLVKKLETHLRGVAGSLRSALVDSATAYRSTALDLTGRRAQDDQSVSDTRESVAQSAAELKALKARLAKLRKQLHLKREEKQQLGEACRLRGPTRAQKIASRRREVRAIQKAIEILRGEK